MKNIGVLSSLVVLLSGMHIAQGMKKFEDLSRDDQQLCSRLSENGLHQSLCYPTPVKVHNPENGLYLLSVTGNKSSDDKNNCVVRQAQLIKLGDYIVVVSFDEENNRLDIYSKTAYDPKNIGIEQIFKYIEDAKSNPLILDIKPYKGRSPKKDEISTFDQQQPSVAQFLLVKQIQAPEKTSRRNISYSRLAGVGLVCLLVAAIVVCHSSFFK